MEQEEKRPLNIDLICNDGSPIGVIPPHIHGQGVGGAELAMMSLMQTFAERGHAVSVYNDPVSPGEYDGVQYKKIVEYNPRGQRDVLIIFRSPNARALPMLARLRTVFWSTDQYTVGDFTALHNQTDFTVVISPHHRNYHIHHWKMNSEKLGVIDLGVRLDEYDYSIQKVPNQLIYCSVPDRGLQVLHSAWPVIVRDVPDATLAITSDYRLWGSASPGNTRYRLDFAGMKGVTFYGKVPRSELIKLQLESEIMAYPCIYEELFCVSAAECQVAGAIPVTTGAGSLPTTNEFGYKIPGDPRSPQFTRGFTDRIVSLLTDERNVMEARREKMTIAARKRFAWNSIAEKWEKIFLEGKL